MNRFFYQRLALNNIRKNAKLYIPYLLTCIGTIMMFYNMCFLVVAKDIGSVSDSGSVRYLLFLGAIVIGIFSVLFLFYTNSFLIKRRKNEFGLFNILGLEKKHIGTIMVYETLFITAVSLGLGLLTGILFSKMIILLLLKIISFKATFGFEVPRPAVLSTITLFGAIFCLNLIYNIVQVYRSKPVDLLKGDRVGEKEPKTKWLLAIIGTICLGSGYMIALTIDSPIAALMFFFVAVILVIAGTYCLFTAGSIALLKMLRRKKNYYYQANHFVMISGMIYRMKQNAAGLANICILSTAVIIMVSTTLSLYAGMEDVLRTRFPRNIIVEASDVSAEQAEKLNDAIQQQILAAKVSPKNTIHYRFIEFDTIQNKDSFVAASESSYYSNRFATLIFIPFDEYRRMTAVEKPAALKKDEALLYVGRGDIPGEVLNLNGMQLNIKERLPFLYSKGEETAMPTNSYYLVVKDTDTVEKVYRALSGNSGNTAELAYYCGFDVSSDNAAQIQLTNDLQETLNTLEIKGYVDGAEISRSNFYVLYGGLLFLGIFLGLLFIMATVLIIYYKQIAEGYEDKERFNIMQKVGMSHAEVKQAIRSQVLTVFFLPLVTAILHIVVAFKVITELLSALNLNNIPLFAVCTALTILVFAVFYIIVYLLTARTYYRIVS